MMKKNPPSKLFSAVALMAGALLAASCNQKNAPVVTIANCPAVAGVAHMTTLTRFASESRTNDAVQFDAYLTQLDHDCDDSDNVETEISFTINAKRGPALQNPVQTIDYFVVVLRDNYLVTAKKKYSTQIRFAPGQETTGVRETILQEFADSATLRRYDYEVLIGFDLDPEELEFNVIR